MGMPIVSWCGYQMNNCKTLLILLLVTLSPAATFAATDGHPVSLWLAEGAHNRVYLLGSIHALRKSDHPLPSIIETAYDDAESLFMELDMDDLDAVVGWLVFVVGGHLVGGQEAGVDEFREDFGSRRTGW